MDELLKRFSNYNMAFETRRHLLLMCTFTELKPSADRLNVLAIYKTYLVDGYKLINIGEDTVDPKSKTVKDIDELVRLLA